MNLSGDILIITSQHTGGVHCTLHTYCTVYAIIATKTSPVTHIAGMLP